MIVRSLNYLYPAIKTEHIFLRAMFFKARLMLAGLQCSSHTEARPTLTSTLSPYLTNQPSSLFPQITSFTASTDSRSGRMAAVVVRVTTCSGRTRNLSSNLNRVSVLATALVHVEQLGHPGPGQGEDGGPEYRLI